MKRKQGWLWLLSVAAGLLGLIFGVTMSAPIFVDTFHAQHPPTFLDMLIPNLLVILPYALLPASLVLLVGWIIKKSRHSN
jgi:hypothetical protein